MNLSEYSEAFSCGVEAWSGFWGDPLVSGTIMMATYAIATVLVLQAARRLSGLERAIWFAAAIVMALEFANTPLDLHGLAWATGRCLAHIQGWYADRYIVQRNLLILLAVATLAIVAICIVLLRRDLVRNALLLIGVATVLGMTVVKGINYQRIEIFYAARVGPLTVPEAIQLAGIAIAMLAAVLKRRATIPASLGKSRP